MAEIRAIWNSLSRQQKYGVVMFWLVVISLIAILVLSVKQATAQSGNPLTDPWRDTQCTNGVGCTYLYENLVPFGIFVQDQDEIGNFISERVATPLEAQLYAFQKQSRIEEIARNAALIAVAENSEGWQNWVDNRTLELTTCESNMNAILALGNFNTLTNGEQNQSWTALITCTGEMAKAQRKAWQTLHDALVAEGLVVN